MKKYSFIQSFLLVETIIETMWKQFLKKKLLAETIFLASEKHFFFHLLDIPGCENSFSIKWKRIF